MVAERAVIEIELIPDLVVDGLRDADRPGLCECLEPRGNIDAVAEDIVAIDDNVAEIHTDPQLEATLQRDGVVHCTRRSLHLESATERVDDARKIRQQAVTCGADDPSAMRRDQRVDGAAELAERSMRAGLILAHQAAEPDHIRMQNGREFPFPRGSFPWRMRRVIEQ